jgi:hypothetical protein
MQKPEGAHDILCYHCGHKIVVGGRAQSTSCPGCHKRVMIEDIVVKAYQAVLSLETCGKLIVPKGGQVVAQKRVIAFKGIEIEGKLQCKEAISAGLVVLGPKAEWKGDLKAAALSVKHGAIVLGSHITVPADPLANYQKQPSEGGAPSR